MCCNILTLEQGKTTTDAMGDVWRGLEVVEAATRVGTDMLVRRVDMIDLLLHRLCAFILTLYLFDTGRFIAKLI